VKNTSFYFSCIGLIILGSATCASAAELLRSASIFEAADQGSKQVLILKKGAHVDVTGNPEMHDGVLWSPVKEAGVHGWIETISLQTSDGEATTATPENPANLNSAEPSALPAGKFEAYPSEFYRLSRTRYWFGLGPSFETTSGYSVDGASYSGNSYGGATFAAGMDVLLGAQRRFVLQFKFLFPWNAEVSQGYAAGRIQRLEFFPGFGYQIIPQTLEVLFHPGLTYIWGEDENFYTKIAFTPGVSISLTLSSSARNSFYQGLEFGIYRSELTSGAADDGLTEGICSAFSPNDSSCTNGVAPAAFQFVLLYKIGGQH
jgi:hypothetical protein